MKKGLVFVFVLFILSFVSSAAIDVKPTYDKGETLISKISGNFVDPILEENVYFYRGYVRIPMDYDVAKVNGTYYLVASLLGKTENNYSIAIKDVRHYEFGQISSEDITGNFSITSSIADFYIVPGFIVSSGDFSMEVYSLSNSEININVEPFSGITSNDLVLGPSEASIAIFSTSSLQQSSFGILKLSTSNTEYEVPASISKTSASGPYCGDGKIDSGEQCDGTNWSSVEDCSDFGFDSGNLSCNSPGSTNECTFDIHNCVNVSAPECNLNSDCLSGYECKNDECVKKQVECEEDRDCDDDEICSKNECVPDDSECKYDRDCDSWEECTGGECVLKNNNECLYDEDCAPSDFCLYGSCVPQNQNQCDKDGDCEDNQECISNVCADKNECDSDRDCPTGEKCSSQGQCIDAIVQQTCTELQGVICARDQLCDGNATTIQSNVCCIGSCKKSSSGSSSKTIGWLLIGILVLALAFFYIKYKRTKRIAPDFSKVGLKR
jgi:hypothetical protein